MTSITLLGGLPGKTRFESVIAFSEIGIRSKHLLIPDLQLPTSVNHYVPIEVIAVRDAATDANCGWEDESLFTV
jgi:hypothetical protein